MRIKLFSLAAALQATLALSAHAGNVDLTTLKGPFGAVDGWSASKSPNALVLSRSAGFSNSSLTIDNTLAVAAGNFVITVDESSSRYGSGGIFFDNNNGFLGIGFLDGAVNQSYNNGGFSGFTFFNTPSVPLTLRLSREGDTGTAAYSDDGGSHWTTLYTVTSPTVQGAGALDLNAGSAVDTLGLYDETITYSNLSITPEPGSWTLMILALGAVGATARTRRVGTAAGG